MKTIKRRILSIELNFSWSWDLAIHTSQSHTLTSQLSPLSIQAYFFYNPIHVHWYIFYPSKISTIFCPWGIHISVPSFLEWSSHRCLFNLYPSSRCYITIPTFLITPILHSNSHSIDPSFHDSYHHNAHYTFKFWSYIVSFFLLNIKFVISAFLFPPVFLFLSMSWTYTRGR